MEFLVERWNAQISGGTPVAKAVLWTFPDAEERKRGERTGLDTLVVHAVNGGCWMWGPSARVVRCWVKSRNERNPRSLLPARYGGDSVETAGVNSEEGGDDVKSSCPLCPGLHACYNGRYKELRACEGERISESRSQFGLGSATRPHEVGVASNRRSATLR